LPGRWVSEPAVVLGRTSYNFAEIEMESGQSHLIKFPGASALGQK